MTIRIIRTDGTEEQHTIAGARPLAKIERLIGAQCTDVVNLRDGRVMIVDGNGWECRFEERPWGGEMVPIAPNRPINPKATALYHAVCQAGTSHQIAGDVAIANDRDFA